MMPDYEAEYSRWKKDKKREANYLKKIEPISLFLRENCEEDPSNGYIVHWEFYERFKNFLLEKKYRIQSKNEVSRSLTAKYEIKSKLYKNAYGEQKLYRTIFGIRWKDEKDKNKENLISYDPIMKKELSEEKI